MDRGEPGSLSAGPRTPRSSFPAASRRASAISSCNATWPEPSSTWWIRKPPRRTTAAPGCAARDAFYVGDIAGMIVDYHRTNGGWMTAEDLASSGRFRRTRFGDIDLFACGPWCQGPGAAGAQHPRHLTYAR
jgi:hypothetical protein